MTERVIDGYGQYPLGADGVKVPLSNSPSFPYRKWERCQLQGPLDDSGDYSNWVSCIHTHSRNAIRLDTVAPDFVYNSL